MNRQQESAELFDLGNGLANRYSRPAPIAGLPHDHDKYLSKPSSFQFSQLQHTSFDR
jgi:hypothetical protein